MKHNRFRFLYNQKKDIFFINKILKGISQIMLQENALTGLLFLIGIFYGSLFMGMAAIIATFSGTLTALILKYNRKDIDSGIYGFSAALVGVACAFFLKPALIVWIIIILGGSLATVIQHFFHSRNIVVFTFPFVVVTWLILFMSNRLLPHIIIEKAYVEVINSIGVDFGFKGFGQVIFQDTLLAGVLFFIAVFINSPIAALYGLAAATLAGNMSFHVNAPFDQISDGLFSFNAVLCAIVFAGARVKDGFWALLAVLLSLLVSMLMLRWGFIQLTFPFVFASIPILLLKNSMEKRAKLI